MIYHNFSMQLKKNSAGAQKLSSENGKEEAVEREGRGAGSKQIWEGT